MTSLLLDATRVPSANALGHAVPPEWCGVDAPFPLERTVVDWVRERVRATPDAPAVEGVERTLSYADLDGASERVAVELQRRGLRLEEPVPVLLPASPDYIVALLGALKAGGSYLPIETETPLARIEFMLSDSHSRFVLTDPAGCERLRGWAGAALDMQTFGAGSGGTLAAERVQHEAMAARVPPLLNALPSDPQRRMYIMYTSGSTGVPKGVEIEHRAVSNLVCNYIQQLHLTPRDRSSLLAYLSFDVSVADIWPVLCAGGTLVIPPPQLRHNPDELIGWLQARALTLTFIPHAAWRELLFSRPWPERMALRYLTTGGDRLRVRPPAGLPFTVINGYGPTEFTVFGTWSRVAPQAPGQPAPPIGRPMWNTRAYVLDEQRQPLPVGVAGELYLSGIQVARGYLGRGDLTAQAFFPDPFDASSSRRMYRTGDWVRWRADGELDFFWGAYDTQIKVRGARVELGEIEAALAEHPDVRQVCCVPVLDDGTPIGTVAHVATAQASSSASQRLRAYLAERLPAGLVPMKAHGARTAPVNAAGKNRPLRTAKTRIRFPLIRPRPEAANGLEDQLARIWRSMLPPGDVENPAATFFELGGETSLLAMRLLLRVNELTGHNLDYAKRLLRQPTFDGLLAALRGTEF